MHDLRHPGVTERFFVENNHDNARAYNDSKVLENFQSLRVIYQFRIKLQDIWARSTASQKELLDALQEWCQQAEATGIETLRRFAARLKTYVPQEVN